MRPLFHFGVESVKDDNVQDKALAGKLKALMVVRVVIVTILLGSLAVFNVTPLKPAFNLPTVYALILLTYGLTVLYAVIINRVKRLLLFANVQIIIDVILETALVYITGGIESPFPFIYIITILVASTMLYRRGGLLVASLCAILYGGMVDLQYFGILASGGNRDFQGREVVYNVFLNLVAFFLSAVLSSGLAETLKRTSENLAAKSSAYEVLRNLYENIFHSINTGLLTTDMEGHITSFNLAAEEMTGYKATEVIGRLWHDVWALERVRAFYPSNGPSGVVIEEGFSRLRQEMVRRKDGSLITVGITISYLRDDFGVTGGLVASFRNLTQLIAQEERYKRRERLAEIGEMSARMAHEIRNPLASLSGSMQLLRREVGLSGENLQLMEIAIREADRLNQIITEFLTYARPKPLARGSIAPAGMLDEIILLLKNHRGYHENINILQEFDDRGYCIEGDASLVRQVFWNLALNAMEAMPEGGTLRIEGSIYDSQGGDERRHSVRISFRDTGVGISEDDMKRIFLPFFTKKETGTGLGLATVYRIMEDHGGSIDVVSRQGQGSCFTVSFPLAKKQIH